MLRLSGLSVSYGGLHALANVALEGGEGEFVTIVGPNGAGKTTLLKAIGGGVAAGGRGRDRREDNARGPARRRARRLTILLVEQRVVEALELCDRGYVLETGRVTLVGERETLLADPRVQHAYLGA